ncbi:amidohydrolase family protein [Candidatus Palauibacter sp.]|uniref:amidohydrolase family protein n=1 Tax=Candidatus Palauibacter sp. TaxID=3101350 RepID=UPI003B51F0EE
MTPRERRTEKLARMGRAAALAALVASAAAAPAAAQVMIGPGGPGGRQPLPLRSARTASFTATEGTWISLDVSPDGTTIVFDLLGDLYTLPIDGGKASPLLTGMAYETQPRFSPDGESVAFISDRSGGDALWKMRLDLTDTTRVAGGGSSLMLSPEWSPDGVYIVASRSNGLGGVASLAMYHAERGSPLPLPGSSFLKRIGAAFSPDGRYVWYAGGFGDWTYNAVLPLYQLYRYDRETGATTTMTNRYGSAFRPAISPDGRWLVYGTRYNADTGLRKRDLETGEESWLAYPVQRDEQESRAPLDVMPGYAFLPDGSAIVISYGGKIWNVPMDGGEATEIPFEAEVELDVGPQVKFEYQIDTTAMVTASQIRSPVVGPGGGQLVFTAFDRLWIRDLPDGEPRRLTEGDAGEFHPQWSPDGRWIAYTTWDDSDGGHIMKVPVEGGDPIRLSATAALYYNVAWSPDGERIVASRGAARQLKEAAGAFFGPIGGEFVWVPTAGPEPAEAEVISPTGLRDVPHFAADDPDRIYAYSPVEGLVSFRWDGTDVKRHLIVRGRQGIAGIGDPHPNEWEFLPRRVFPWRQGPDPTDPDPPAEPGGPQPAGLIVLSPAGDRAFVQFGRDLFVADLAEVGDTPPTITLFRVDDAPVPVRKVTDVGGEFASWAPDGGALHWALGNVLFTYDLDRVEADEEEEEATAHARALLRVRAAAVTDTLKEKRAEADSLENADEEVPEELEDEITRLQADSVQVEADSLLARADSIRQAAEEVAAKSAAVRAGDEEVLADTTETYEAHERRIEAQLPRDIPRGTVALTGGRIITMTEVPEDTPADTAGAAADTAGAAPDDPAETPAEAAEGEEGAAEAAEEEDTPAEPPEPAMKPRIIEDGVVLVTDNRIVAVGPADSVEVPDSATVIDVSGKTLVPGFIDTHYHAQWLVPEVHPEEVWQYLATLSYGVTTTRDPQTATTDILSYTDRVRTGGMTGPRIYSTGPGVFAGENLRDADHAKTILRRYAEYFDTKTLKMYMTGNRQQRQWIIQAARDLELMPTTEGGLDYKIDITHAIDGYPGIEHNLPIAPIYSDVVELFKTSETTNSPTLLVSYGGPFGENYFYTHEDVLGDEKLATFVPKANIDARARRRGPGAGGSPGEGGWFLEEEYVFPRHGEFVKKMLEADARMAVGSHGQIQGVGYHWELWAMAAGGASNFDLLRAATILGAEAIGFGDQLGSIEEGKFADIVVLNSNPLDELRSTVDIHYVMKDGRLYDGMTLDEIYPEARPLERERPAEESAAGAAAGIRGN